MGNKGECAPGNFSGKLVQVIKTITPNTEHPYVKLDIVEIESIDHTKAFCIQDHGFDI